MGMLGVKIHCDGVTQCQENYDEIKNKIRTVCSNWFNRTLTLFGKTLIINSLVGSLFIYKLSTVLTLNKEQISEIENIIREFIWKGKKPKIALATLQNLKHQGGLKLVNLLAKQDTIKISWIFKLESDSLLRECAYNTLAPKLRQLIWRFNLDTCTI